MSLSATNTMKAVVLHKNGSPDSKETLTVESNVSIPEPLEGEVLIKVKAAAINPVDWKLVKGEFPGKSGGGIGLDVSGVIEKLGPSGVEGLNLKVGDEIYADIAQTVIKNDRVNGSFGEYAVVQAVAASSKPKNINFEQAAALPLAGLTALQGLVTYGNLKEGNKVLIFGGSGGVGSLAIQMAKTLGASEVTATGSSVDTIKSFGADHVVNYKEENLMDALKGKDFDLVYDTVGGYEHWQVGQACLKKKGGTYVTIAGDYDGTSVPGGMVGLIASTMWRKFMSYFGGPAYHLFLTNTSPPDVVNDMKKITELVESGKVSPVLDGRSFQLETDSIHELMKASMSGRAKGKLILKVDC
jgi:alcohol dehydrogenase